MLLFIMCTFQKQLQQKWDKSKKEDHIAHKKVKKKKKQLI